MILGYWISLSFNIIQFTNLPNLKLRKKSVGKLQAASFLLKRLLLKSEFSKSQTVSLQGNAAIQQEFLVTLLEISLQVES